jgi:O-antigen/teichoic acid export membrane protein
MTDQPTTASVWRQGVIGTLALNVASMLTTNVVIRAANLVTYVLVARYLGIVSFGQLSLAVSLFQVLQTVCLWGFPTLITREAAREHKRIGSYFIAGSIITLLVSLAGMATVVVFTRVMSYSRETAQIVLLFHLGLAPYCLSQVCEAVFKATERMQLIALANVPIALLRTVVAVVMLERGWDVRHIALLLVASHSLVLLVDWALLLRYVRLAERRVDTALAKQMLRGGFPFLGIQGTYALNSSMTVIVLSKLAGEAEVGLFNAANQLLVPLGLLFDNVMEGVFPRMCRHYQTGLESLETIARQLVEFMLIIALPCVVLLWVLADAVLLLLYGDSEFVQAAMIVRIVVWLPLQKALTSVLGRILWATHQETSALVMAITNTAMKLLLSVLLTWQFGVMGAAVAALVVAILNLGQHCLGVTRLFGRFTMVNGSWRPLVASACMAACLLLAGDRYRSVAVVCSGLLYLFILLTAVLWSPVGFPRLWSAGQRS